MADCYYNFKNNKDVFYGHDGMTKKMIKPEQIIDIAYIQISKYTQNSGINFLENSIKIIDFNNGIKIKILNINKKWLSNDSHMHQNKMTKNY